MMTNKYLCRSCEAEFLPYEKNSVCPKCGMAASRDEIYQNSDFIEKILMQMRSNKEKTGRYVSNEPIANVLMEDVRLIIFQIFDELEEEKPVDKKKRIEEIVAVSNWRDHKYFREYIKAVAFDVLEMYEFQHLGLMETKRDA